MKITPIIEKYLLQITTDDKHRYKSWDNCFSAFNTSKKSPYHALELAFYLASWGMYRGSSGLLQKNHLVHDKAIDILFSKENLQLKCTSNKEVTLEDIDNIIELKKQLYDYYYSIDFRKGNEELKRISPTDTLLSKIILGTLGCVPAYDRYFKDGLKQMKMDHTDFTKDSLEELFIYITKNDTELKSLQQLILEKTSMHYPLMKILDMYFWLIGYDIAIKEKNKKPRGSFE